jgi:hypothetical protein
MPKDLTTIHDISRLGFVKLDEISGEEIVFGMITNSPTFSGCVKHVSSTQFVNDNHDNIIKAVINFSVKRESNIHHKVSTETRIWCGSKKLKSRFRIYWFFVKHFSQLIRKQMLKQMKKEIEKS